MPRESGDQAKGFGNRGGFLIGWSDWIVNSSALAYVSVAAASFFGSLRAQQSPGIAAPQ